MFKFGALCLQNLLTQRVLYSCLFSQTLFSCLAAGYPGSADTVGCIPLLRFTENFHPLQWFNFDQLMTRCYWSDWRKTLVNWFLLFGNS